jgi:hypothetical protein
VKSRLLLVLATASLLVSVRATGQGEGDLLAQARARVREGKVDSAVVLLRRITDSASWNDSLRRIDALVLLGIAHYYRGDGAASLAAFSAALELDPALEVPRLAELDSLLGALFDSARIVAASAPDPDSLYSCSPRCQGVDIPPKPVDAEPGMTGSVLLLADVGDDDRLHGTALLRAIVDTLGRVETGSVEVVHSTLPREILDQAVQDLLVARYRPGRAHGRAVRVLIEERIDLRPKTH